MSKKNEIIEQDGIKYTVITLSGGNEVKIRHPKGKDLRFAMSAGRSNEADLTFRLASNLTCMSEAELEELEAKDCSLILSAVARFLS